MRVQSSHHRPQRALCQHDLFACSGLIAAPQYRRSRYCLDLSSFRSSTKLVSSSTPNLEDWSQEASLQRASRLTIYSTSVEFVNMPLLTWKWRSISKVRYSNGLFPFKIVLPLLDHVVAAGNNNNDAKIFSADAILCHPTVQSLSWQVVHVIKMIHGARLPKVNRPARWRF